MSNNLITISVLSSSKNEIIDFIILFSNNLVKYKIN